MLAKIKRISFVSFKMPILLCFMILIVFSCMGEDGVDGADGEDGDAFIAYWFVTPFIFVSDDPGIPVIAFAGTYYETEPGTYGLAYEAFDGSVWYANYTITIIEGEDGKPGESGEMFWKDGENGRDGENGSDMCFSLGCWTWGPELSSFECGNSAMRTIIVNNKIEERYETELNQAKDLNLFVPNNKKAVFDASLFNFDYYLDENSNNVIKQEIYSGGYHFELLSKRIK